MDFSASYYVKKMQCGCQCLAQPNVYVGYEIPFVNFATKLFYGLNFMEHETAKSLEKQPTNNNVKRKREEKTISRNVYLFKIIKLFIYI